MNQVSVIEQEPEDHLQTRFAVTGQYGFLRAWHDGSYHKATKEPTFCVDLVYIDRFSGKKARKFQRGLRASTVANMCACICMGEEKLTTELVDKINEKFHLYTLH